MEEATMGQWLIASFLDIHIQVWMALVAGILLLWLILVWMTRSAR
jgi:hypothetical protein